MREEPKQDLETQGPLLQITENEAWKHTVRLTTKQHLLSSYLNLHDFLKIFVLLESLNVAHI